MHRLHKDDIEHCDRCGTDISVEAQAIGWPIAAENGYICPGCYGDDALCIECGKLLAAEEGFDKCLKCRSAQPMNEGQE